MATQKEQINQLSTDVELLKQDVSYIKKDLGKVVDFVDNNQSGIIFSSAISSKVTAVFLTILMAALMYFVVKSGGIKL